MIHRYLKDKATPSVGFLGITAKLLNVQDSWLIEGVGERTKRAQVFADIGEGDLWVDAVGWPEKLKERIRGAAPTLASSAAPFRVRAMFWEAIDRLSDAARSPEETVKLAGLLDAVAVEPLLMLNAPISASSADRAERQRVGDYYMGILRAIMAIIPDCRPSLLTEEDVEPLSGGEYRLIAKKSDV